MDNRFVFRILAGSVLIGVIAGIGYLAFNAGVAQGTASQMPVAQPDGPAVGVPPYPPFGYGMPYWRPFPFFGMGCFAPLLGIFLLFLALRLFGFIFWGHRWGHWHHGPWRAGWTEGEAPPMFQEWHRRAHGEPEAGTKSTKV